VPIAIEKTRLVASGTRQVHVLMGAGRCVQGVVEEVEVSDHIVLIAHEALNIY
jgi:hypothetical protein